VKRVYIAGEVERWTLGDFCKRSGRMVHGVQIGYTQSRRRYRRQAFHAARGNAEYDVRSSSVPQTNQHFTQVVELPQGARNVDFHAARTKMPDRYRHALQRVR
jgi:hypothetical protein